MSNTELTTIGAVLDLGCRTALGAWPAHELSKILVLNTEAHTEVAAAWARRHRDRACRG
ncbi:hypothetical protein ABZU76_46210 [Amycolatopsis sp. NPDC005232]|uniref:hypothetical protein n=1 Tax=Amycolatopsis sp. NPDC005232 TaxID=3157027 RepID=UPI0033A78295